MNRYWHIPLYCFMVLGCHGQKKNPADNKKQSYKDSVVVSIDSVNVQVNKIISKDTTKEVKLDSVNKEIVKKKILKKEPLQKRVLPQTAIAKIWNEEQIAFLNQVDKILLFHVRITEIGSRKLDLDSKLSADAHQELIKALLSENSYPSSKMVESSNVKKFEPNYQMLLEAGEERITLMFDKVGLKMVVASLYGREKFDVNPSLIEHVEKLKKGE